MVALVNSEIDCLGSAGNVVNSLLRSIINLQVRFALSVELIRAKKNSIKGNISALNAVTRPLVTMQAEE